MTKFPCPLFLMIAKDCTERMSAVALSVGLILFRAANASRVTWSERVRHWNALTETAWEDALQGLGLATPTVASEKNRKMLFIGNVFYKQWHLWVLFHYCFEGTTSWKSQILIPSNKPHFRYTSREIKNATMSEFSTSLKSSKSREQFLLWLTLFYSIYG